MIKMGPKFVSLHFHALRTLVEVRYNIVHLKKCNLQGTLQALKEVLGIVQPNIAKL